MIRYKCSKCGMKMESPSSLSGQVETCSGCNTVVTVPRDVSDDKNLPRREIFLSRAVRLFKEGIRRQFRYANDWRRDATQAVDGLLGAGHKWMFSHKIAVILGLGGILWLGMTIWFVVDAVAGKVEGSAVQVGVGGVIGGAIVGLLISPIIGVVAFLTILLVNWSFRFLVAVVLFLPLVLWTPIYGLWRTLFVIGQCLLLVPLFFLFILTRVVQLWKGIFHTCPSRECAYRGLPAYVCPECDEVNEKLWPNLYGLLWHHCTRCDHKLPTLDMLGRRKLERLCGKKDCRIPLLGRHAGRVPERLVAIVGGPTSGKTCYLLMAVNQIVNDHSDARIRISGEIDDASQEQAFKREWAGMSRGEVAAKTAEVSQAFLMYTKVGSKRCQLYLYDAPGEEFASLGSMVHQRYFPLIEGFILLVDPETFETVGGRECSQGRMSLQNVVNSTLGMALSGMQPESNGKFDKRVAVVISKADLKKVRNEIGDISQGAIPSDQCREAILNWDRHGNALRAIEQMFDSVQYFACSQLGRNSDQSDRKAFTGSGLLEPLHWILTGQTS